MTIGNVCPAFTPTPHAPDEYEDPGHEPTEGIHSALGPFNGRVRLHVCKHCGAIYAESAGEGPDAGD